MTQNLALWEPLNVISLGAGVQSSTMGLMAGHGEITPMPDGAIFADTKGEPASVYTWLKWLKTQLPYPVYTVSAGSLAKANLKMKGSRFSPTIPFFTQGKNGKQGKNGRGCTRDFKLKPLLSKQRELIAAELPAWRKRHKEDLQALTALKRWFADRKAKEISDDLADPIYKDDRYALKITTDEMPPANLLDESAAAWKSCQSDPLIISWIGISLDEVSRMKDSREPWILHRHPLIEKRMTRQDCLQWMSAHGYPQPPRSACVYCPFHNDAEWRRLRDEEPKEFARAARFEKQLQKTKAQSSNFRTQPFLHRSLVQLSRVDLRSEGEMGQLNFFENDCSGMCGV
jgi:hypothetical protein